MTDLRRGLARRSIAGVAWNALFMGTLGMAELVALVILARLLSPPDLGLYAAAYAVIAFSTIFASLGVAPAIVQRPALEERHVRVGFTVSLILGLTIAGANWVLAPDIAGLLRLPDLAPVVQAACVVLVCQGCSVVAEATAQRALRFRWLAGIEASTKAFGYLVVGPALAWFGFGIWALVGALLTQHVLRMLMLLAGQPHPKRPMLERRAIAELLYFGGGYTLARIFNQFAGHADKLVVGRWLGADALGLYTIAARLMTTPAVLAGEIIDRVLFPAMALVQNEPVRLARAYRTAVAACTLAVLPASLVVMIVAPELVRMVLGERWNGVVVPLQVLACGMLFRANYKLSDSLARATGAVYARAWRQAVFAVAVVLGSVTGQFWGVAGVALGVVAAITGNYLLMAQLSLRLTGMGWRDFAMAHLPGVVLGGTIGTGAWILAERLRELDVAPPVILLDVVLLAVLGALLLCWLLPALFLGPDGRSALRTLASLTPARARHPPPG